MNEPAADSVLLKIENLKKTYPDGHVQALVDLNLTIMRGEYVAVMGPSGSGKSTLLNMVGGLDVPDSGDVIFEGQSLAGHTDLDKFRSEKIGFVFQSFYLLPTLTAVENVQIPMFEGPMSPLHREKKALELIESVAIAHRANHLPQQLSVGERQRVAIARSLANDPQLLLADEPTGNLDSKTADEVLDLFDVLHRERGMTIVMVTHSDEVGCRAERLIRLKDGEIIEDTRAAATKG